MHPPTNAKSSKTDSDSPHKAKPEQSPTQTHDNPIWFRLATRVPAQVTVSPPDDPTEHQAEQVADQVVAMPNKSTPGDGSDSPPADPPPPGFPVDAPSAGGQPLSANDRAFFEPRFGRDFSSVRLHTDAGAHSAAVALKAKAFTVGHDIAFRAGQYAPQSTNSRGLLAHELAHVALHSGATTPNTAVIRRSPDEPAAIPLLAEDTETDLAPGQMRRVDFLSDLAQAVCEAIEPVLASKGRTTENCPYVDVIFRYLDRLPLDQIERAVRNVAPEMGPDTPASDYIALITDRVRESAENWAATGTITGLPEGLIPPALAGSVAPEADAETQPQVEGGTEPPVQFQEKPGGARGGVNPAAVRAELGAGRPVEGGVRSRMESVFGTGLGDVRTHTDPAAAGVADRLNARAFAVGRHVAFGPGEYRPGTLSGDALIAHEFAHVVQQRGADDVGELGESNSTALEEDADTAAAAAVGGLWKGAKNGVAGLVGPARPRRSSGLRLQRCGGPEPPSEEEVATYLATKHLRIVVIQETHDFLAGMRKSVAVAANPSAALADHEVREGDELIQHGWDWPRLMSVIVDMPPPSGSGDRYVRPSSPHARTGNFTVHFMSEGTYNITANVLLAPGHPVQVRKSISVRKPEFEKESESAAPADLSSGARTVEQERLAWHLHRADVRQKAATAGLIPQPVVDSWTDVSIAVLQRVALIEQGQPLGQTQAEITTALDGFAGAVRGTVGGIPATMQTAVVQARVAAGSTTVHPIRNAIDALSSTFDQWVLGRIESRADKEHELYKSLQFALQSEREVESLQRRSTVPPVRIPAIFHPKSAYLHQGAMPTSPMSTGRIVSVQLNLWLFREGTDEWTLRDISNPEETSEYDVTTSDRDAAIDDLIGQLSTDDEHLPEGRLYIQPPGRPRKTIDVVSSMDFLDWLQVIGIALIVTGAIVATAGMATPGIVAVGGYFIAAGSVVTAAAAVADTVQAYERGRLTATRLALNALQVVASVATAGSATIMARAARVGMLARLGSNARYVFLNRTAAAADVVTMLVMTGDAVTQIARLSGGNNQNGAMIAQMLIGQLLIQGTLTVVSARDAFGGNLGAHPHLSIDDAADGSGLVIRAAVETPHAPRLGGIAPEVPPTGAAHGPDVHPLTNVRTLPDGAIAGNLGPSRVGDILKKIAKSPRARGATLTRVTDSHYTMAVPSASGPVIIDIHVTPTATLPPSPSHVPSGGGASQAGSARFELIPPTPPGGNWRANVSLDNRLPLANAEFLLGNELDEIADIFHVRPRATTAEIAAEMDNSVFRRNAGSNPPITADDRATAGELFEIHSKRIQLLREQASLSSRPAASLSADETARLAQVGGEITAHTASIAKLSGYMALDENANMLLKMRLLREAAIDPNRLARVPTAVRQEVMAEWEKYLGDMRLHPAAASLAAHSGAFGPGGVGPTAFTSETAAHLMFPEPHAPVPKTNPAQFRDSGISGGHHDSALIDFQNNHPEYGYYFHLEGTETAGGETYRRYAQYMWNGTGPPPARGSAGHPSGSGPLDPGWIRAAHPKTTVTNIAGFLEDSERALWQWVRHPTRQPTYFGTGATGGTSIEFTQKVPGGPRITGFFDFDPTKTGAARFRIRTAFIEASWIP